MDRQPRTLHHSCQRRRLLAADEACLPPPAGTRPGMWRQPPGGARRSRGPSVPSPGSASQRVACWDSGICPAGFRIPSPPSKAFLARVSGSFRRDPRSGLRWNDGSLVAEMVDSHPSTVVGRTRDQTPRPVFRPSPVVLPRSPCRTACPRPPPFLTMSRPRPTLRVSGFEGH